ncbi:MAG: hypothetical protein EBQ89_05855 [Alphaproteobacteria bacterium]|nr:hypothetical protein [Alphaproteobacteria bacterium]
MMMGLEDERPPLTLAAFNRFFIELPPADDPHRRKQSDLQKNRAEEFVGIMQGWLIEARLAHLVRQLNVTLLGQIQIVCTAEVIDIIRKQDVVPIAAIRSARDTTDRMGAFVHNMA